jgi:hypothetical protein
MPVIAPSACIKVLLNDGDIQGMKIFTCTRISDQIYIIVQKDTEVSRLARNAKIIQLLCWTV